MPSTLASEKRGGTITHYRSSCKTRELIVREAARSVALQLVDSPTDEAPAPSAKVSGATLRAGRRLSAGSVAHTDPPAGAATAATNVTVPPPSALLTTSSAAAQPAAATAAGGVVGASVLSALFVNGNAAPLVAAGVAPTSPRKPQQLGFAQTAPRPSVRRGGARSSVANATQSVLSCTTPTTTAVSGTASTRRQRSASPR